MAAGIQRRNILKTGLSALGLLALDGLPVFAAPAGFKPNGNPNLVLGVLSDTHLRVGWNGVKPHGGFPLKYVRNALNLFRSRNIDGLVHCGDMAHRGMVREMEFHRDLIEEVWGKGGGPARLFVTGNHEWFGNVKGFGGPSGVNLYKDPAERAKHTLCGDFPAHWERIWGEKYEPVWHKEVKGYHFFGHHWKAGEKDHANLILQKAGVCSLKGAKPFFILSHLRNHFAFNKSLRAFPNAIALFGHFHVSNADWKTIYFDSFGGFFPSIQVGACRFDGGNCFDYTGEKTLKVKAGGDKRNYHNNKVPSRQAMVVNVYDEMVVLERHEVGQGGKLGPDWVLPLGQYKPNPFSRGELAKTIGEPQFGEGARLGVGSAKSKDGEDAVRLTIPLANGNPYSRVFAYDVVIVGEDPEKRLFKSVYFEGCNLGVGHEPGNGLTLVDIPNGELPAGTKFTIAVRPISSLGTKGKSISAKCVLRSRV